MFRKATKTQAKGRLALIGPAGSGKTYTSLSIGTALGSRVALIDTEHGSAEKYGDVFDFDTCRLDTFHPRTYIEAIRDASRAGYDVLIIDSLSHAWSGTGGALELKDQASKKSGNSFTAWADVTPLHNSLINAILAAPMHVIATMRSKTEYVQEKDDRGKQVVRKIGTAPIQRDGVEYEFDIVGELTIDNTLYITKTRAPVLRGAVIEQPGADLADTLRAWLDAGAAAPDADRAQLVLELQQARNDARKRGVTLHDLTREDAAAMTEADLLAEISMTNEL